MAYISVADAVERTGKGSTTIYRLCRKHEHTKHVMREDKKFLIDEDFLSQHYESPASDAEGDRLPGESRRELVDIFIEELLHEKNYYRQLLDRKDEQMERKDQMIVRLQERQKELHYLLNHQSNLLDQLRKPAESAPEPPASSQENSNREGMDEQLPFIYEAKTIYTILAAVGAVLLLAIIFVDEIRTLVE
ncbi:hypothetical protein [Nafulsella turpanensis]|uniref:hypothetical protein n=1 Tax=Nafulsella turpanensis TaxID=1265690 RepID=UPI001269842F|nr:hypothetical protein [Nafulsella turpanensis]